MVFTQYQRCLSEGYVIKIICTVRRRCATVLKKVLFIVHSAKYNLMSRTLSRALELSRMFSSKSSRRERLEFNPLTGCLCVSNCFYLKFSSYCLHQHKRGKRIGYYIYYSTCVWNQWWVLLKRRMCARSQWVEGCGTIPMGLWHEVYESQQQ